LARDNTCKRVKADEECDQQRSVKGRWNLDGNESLAQFSFLAARLREHNRSIGAALPALRGRPMARRFCKLNEESKRFCGRVPGRRILPIAPRSFQALRARR
jgi:hypothetical protein